MLVKKESLRQIKFKDFLIGKRSTQPTVKQDSLAKMEEWNDKFGSPEFKQGYKFPGAGGGEEGEDELTEEEKALMAEVMMSQSQQD